MSKHSPMVLLVGRSLANSSPLIEQLMEQGCQVRSAASYAEAHALLNHTAFDVVLSSLSLPDGSASRLIPWLVGSKTSMFFSFPVERGTWRLPALERGEVRWGTVALRASDFLHRVNKLVRQVGRAGESTEAGRAQTEFVADSGVPSFSEVQT